MDFRGRAYPIPPHLSHIGDDLSRGLLQFEEAKPLGVRGLRWLKIHLANLYGYDKANFDERVLWVEEHVSDIYDSAEKPLEVSLFFLGWSKSRYLLNIVYHRDDDGGQRQTIHGNVLLHVLNCAMHSNLRTLPGIYPHSLYIKMGHVTVYSIMLH